MGRYEEATQRVNIQLPKALKAEAEEMAARKGESLSAFLREGARERIARIRREEHDRLLREAYEAMAADNARTAAEYEPADLEGWE